MTENVYRLPDEPLPSGLDKYAVDPMWPLFAVMLGGNLFGLAWFAINGFALGAQGRGREFATMALSLFGTAAMIVGLGLAQANGWLQGVELQYAALSLVALKLGCAYMLYMWQASTYEIWEHYGGQPRNGMVVLILVMFFGRNLLNNAPLPDLLRAVLR